MCTNRADGAVLQDVNGQSPTDRCLAGTHARRTCKGGVSQAPQQSTKMQDTLPLHCCSQGRRLAKHATKAHFPVLNKLLPRVRQLLPLLGGLLVALRRQVRLRGVHFVGVGLLGAFLRLIALGLCGEMGRSRLGSTPLISARRLAARSRCFWRWYSVGGRGCLTVAALSRVMGLRAPCPPVTTFPEKVRRCHSGC